MTLDPAGFRQIMSQYPTGVAVVATAVGDRIHAMTVGSFTSVSLEPPLALFCLANRAHLASLIAPGLRFSVNFLRADQPALSTYFAGSWKEPAPPPHRFVAWRDVPRLEGVAATLRCGVVSIVAAGDHQVVIGEVLDSHLGLAPRDPLVFFDRRYHSLDSTSGAAAPELDSPDPSAQVFHETW
jgi:flavin reductase (DIM6/NTAB) family NADH-FMN oxidoreductase RutF